MLKALPRDAMRQVGEDVKTVQLGWPLGMPLVRKLEKDLWEVRTQLSGGMARVFFTVDGDYIYFVARLPKEVPEDTTE